jgi:hypothetical protein
MNIRHLILEQTSMEDLQNLLDANAKNGFRAISISSHYGPKADRTIYTALMVKHGDGSNDIFVKMYNKLDTMDSNLMYIETNTQK